MNLTTKQKGIIMGQYSDTKTPKNFSNIVIARRVEDDEYSGPPDKMDDGFYPLLEDCDGDTAQYAQLKGEAEKRMVRYEVGAWNYIGVRAVAQVNVPIGNGSMVTYTLKSPGLWGIESDSGEEYLQDVFMEQVRELLGHIKCFTSALENVEIEKA